MERKRSQPPRLTSTPRPCRNTNSFIDHDSFYEMSPILPNASAPLRKTKSSIPVTTGSNIPRIVKSWRPTSAEKGVKRSPLQALTNDIELTKNKISISNVSTKLLSRPLASNGSSGNKKTEPPMVVNNVVRSTDVVVNDVVSDAATVSLKRASQKSIEMSGKVEKSFKAKRISKVGEALPQISNLPIVFEDSSSQGINNKMKDHTVGESILKNIEAGRASCAWQMPVSSRKTSISLKTKRSVSFNEKKDNLVQLPITGTAKMAVHQDEAPDELSPLDIIPQSKRKTYTLKKQSVRKTSLLSKKCRESNSTYVLNCLSVENDPKSINKPMSTQQEVKPALNCNKSNIDKPLLTEEKSPKDITSNNNNVVPFKVIEDSKGIEVDKVIEENKVNGESKLFIEQCENDVESGQVLATDFEKFTVRKSVRKRKPINYNYETKVDSQEPLTKRKRGRPSKSIKILEQKASENIDKKVSDNEFSKVPNKKTDKTVMKKTIVDEKPSGNIDENVSNKESSEAASKKSSKRVIKKTTVEETPSENIDENVSSKKSSDAKSKKSSKTVVKKTTVEEIPFENIDENVSKKESSKAPIKKTSKGVMKKTVAKQILKSQKQTIEENSSCLTNDKGVEEIEHRVRQEEESSGKSKKKVLKEDVPKTAPAHSKKHLNNEQIKSDEILAKATKRSKNISHYEDESHKPISASETKRSNKITVVEERICQNPIDGSNKCTRDPEMVSSHGDSRVFYTKQCFKASHKLSTPEPGVSMQTLIYINHFVMTGYLSIEPHASISKSSTNTTYFVIHGVATVQMGSVTTDITPQGGCSSFFIPKHSSFSITNNGESILKLAFTKFNG